MRDVEEFWDELIAQIEARQVIPVVGAELLSVRDGDRDTPLYEHVAARLLQKYRVEPTEVSRERYHELNDAVCALAARSRRVQDLYRPVHELLVEAANELAAESHRALHDLAGIEGFTLFVTTTPDDLLARAIDQERHEGRPATEHLVFAPKLTSGATVDLPEVRSSAYTAVCYLLGKASASPFVFAIHDEDTLEFVHNLQLNSAEGMRRLFSELRQRSLLFVGCNFADWLSRMFIRVANTTRLADNRGKREFLAEHSTAHSGSLTLFLERFSPDTWVFPGTATEFVTELVRRWRERHPRAAAGPALTIAPPSRRTDAAPLFLSYSRDDLGAARQLYAELQEIGADVTWFDKSALHAGDEWHREIRNAITGCYLFLPLISTNTDSRDEGYFREEWTQASERVRKIQGRRFIVPVVIDRQYDGNAGRFDRVPDSFPRIHFGHAPDGHLSDELRTTLVALIRERREQRSA